MCQKWVSKKKHHHNEQNSIIPTAFVSNQQDLVYFQFGISRNYLQNVLQNSIMLSDQELETEMEVQTEMEVDNSESQICNGLKVNKSIEVQTDDKLTNCNGQNNIIEVNISTPSPNNEDYNNQNNILEVNTLTATSNNEDTVISIGENNILIDEVNLLCDFFAPSDILDQINNKHIEIKNIQYDDDDVYNSFMEEVESNSIESDVTDENEFISYCDLLYDTFPNVHFSLLSYEVFCLYLEQLNVSDNDLMKKIYNCILSYSISSQ